MLFALERTASVVLLKLVWMPTYVGMTVVVVATPPTMETENACGRLR
ncbi:hypothetical protein [Hyphomicrobium sp. 2TAF46]